MNWIVLLRLNWSALIHRVTGDIKYPAQDTFTDRHRDGSALICNFEAAFETLGGSHGDCSDQFVPEVLLHFERHRSGLVLNSVFNGQRVVDPRQCFRELYIYHRTGNFDDLAFVHIHTQFATALLTRSGRRRFPVTPS